MKKTSNVSLEEQVASHVKVEKSIVRRIKRIKDQLDLMMAQIERSSGNNETPTCKTQHQALQDVG